MLLLNVIFFSFLPYPIGQVVIFPELKHGVTDISFMNSVFPNHQFARHLWRAEFR
jgi:hypothetical protein